MPSRALISPPTHESVAKCRRHAREPLSRTHRTRCSMSHTNAARDARYTCTRYPGLTARMLVGSGRAMDAPLHSDLAANTRIRCHVHTACPRATLALTALGAPCNAPMRHGARYTHAPATLG